MSETQNKVLDVEVIDLGHDVTAWLVHDDSVPVISVNFGFNGGAALDPEGKSGRTNLLASMLNEGAGELESQDFLTLLENHGITLQYSAGRDGIYGEMRTVTQFKDKAFDLLRLSVLEPRLDAEPLERMRAEIVSSLRARQSNPQFLASKVFFSTLFASHPYAKPKDGEIEDIRTLTRDDLIQIVDTIFARDTLHIAIAGDITAEDVKAQLAPLVEALQPEAKVDTVLPKATLNALGTTVNSSFPIPQSIVMFAHQGITSHDPDWQAAQILNYIYGGGGFKSRLMDEIREKRGLTYGIYTQLWDADYGEMVIGQTSTANENVPLMRELITTERQKILKTPPTAEEIADAKVYLIGSLPLRLGSTRAIASTLLGLKRDNLPPDYLDARKAKINAVTAQDLQRVTQRLLGQEPFWLFFGDAAESENEDE